MSILSKLLIQEQNWKPSRAKDPTTYDWFVQELKRISKANFDRLPDDLNSPSFSISFLYYIEKTRDANAFATQLRGFRDRHVVAISQPLVFEMHRALHSPDLVKIVRSSFRSLEREFTESIPLWMSYYVFSFISYHEVGHIVRGHSGYQLYALKGPRKYYEMSDLRQSAYDRAYYLCEFDADGVGATAVAIELNEKAELIALKTKTSVSECLLNLVLIAATAICVLFLIFDAKRQGASIRYPDPMYAHRLY